MISERNNTETAVQSCSYNLNWCMFFGKKSPTESSEESCVILTITRTYASVGLHLFTVIYAIYAIKIHLIAHDFSTSICAMYTFTQIHVLSSMSERCGKQV